MDFTVLFEIVPFYLFALIVPIILVLWQIVGKNDSKFDWIIRFVFSGSTLLWLYLLLPWSQLNYYLRYIFPILFLIASIYSFQKAGMFRVGAEKILTKAKKSKLPENLLSLFKKIKLKDYLYYAVLVIMSFLFLLTCITCFRAQFYPAPIAQLNFPFKGGEYVFVQAGSNVALNYHNPVKPQKYAYDILKLDSFGFRGKSVFSDNLSDFYIFDETVYAPCTGVVFQLNNFSEDMPIMQMNEREPSGNNVILDCNDARVSLVHFKKGSVLVSQGQIVLVGQPLGKIGNSGRTTEPHLHIQAENSLGEGIPIAFNGKTFVRNDILNVE